MRGHRIVGGLSLGIAAGAAWLFVGCGTDTSGTCSDTNSCGVDSSVAEAGGYDVPSDAPLPDGGPQVDGTAGDEAVADGATADTTLMADGSLEASSDDGGAEAGADAGDGGVDADAAEAGCEAGQEPWQAACVVSDAFGVFVSTQGSDSAPGTMEAPVQTIAMGIHIAAGNDAGAKRVYVCNGQYPEQVVLDGTTDGVSVYGGLDCTTPAWTWVAGQKAHVTWTKPLYALAVKGTRQRVEIADMAFTVTDAVGTDDAGAGQSSVAALVSEEDAGVVLWRVELHAGQGTSGADGGGAPSNWYAAADAGLEALRGNGANDAGAGGAAKTCTCPMWGTTTGGAGGDAGDPAGNGGDGTATPKPVTPEAGANGMGGAGYNDQTVTCVSGRPGADGLPRSTADGGFIDAGAVEAGDATVSVAITASGWTTMPGVNGLAGNPGQGGGGGGGGQTGGAGGGGCGGCGGSGGLAGQPAGSSIGLLVYQSVVDLEEVTITTSNAGNGGAGGPGENGGGGGGGGNVGACGGGNGGSGAGGQGGGGGAGGVSAAIVRTSASTVTWDADGGLSWVEAGTAGAGGAGGPGGAGGTAGDAGNAGATGVPGADGLPADGGSSLMLTY